MMTNGAVVQQQAPEAGSEPSLWSVRAHVERVKALPVGRDLPLSALDVLALVGRLADQYLELMAHEDAVDRRLVIRDEELARLGLAVGEVDDPVRERLLRERALYRGRREAIVDALQATADRLRLV